MVPIKNTSVATHARHKTSEASSRSSGTRHVAWGVAKMIVSLWRLIGVFGYAVGSASYPLHVPSCIINGECERE
jgi:hypothetical protein